jgi:glycerol-3-phosphate acyltransferase PlsY
VLAWAGATAALIVARHHDNIRRLLGGSEHVVEAS